MEELLMGIDVGTTNVKAGLFSLRGDLVSQGSASYKTSYPGRNMAEQKPEDWWEATIQAINRMMSNVKNGQGHQILGISVSSQTPSLVALDENGMVIRDAMIWMDRRAQSEMDEIVDKLGAETFKSITGAVPDAFYLLPKLYWYKKNEAANFQKTKWILQANGYINYRLTGEMSLDNSSADLTLCVDARTGEFSKEIEEVTGIPFGQIFPARRKNWEIIGKVNPQAASMLHIAAGIPVVAGTTDTIASLLSFGLSQPGEAAEITGTSTLAFFAHGEQITNPGKLMRKSSPISGIEAIINAPINATGASVRWYLDNIGINQREAQTSNDIYEVFTEYARTSKAGAQGLFFLPYMMGERGPLWNSYAKGMFIGMKLDTTYREMARAILEGTAYALRHVCDEYRKIGGQPISFRASGGGAKNHLWLEIKASVLGMPMLVPDEKCGNAMLGDALLAGKAVGIYEDIGKISKEIVGIKKIIEPNPEWVKVYDALYPYYRNMYSHLEEDLKGLEYTMKELS